jgi:hypothetical protein
MEQDYVSLSVLLLFGPDAQPHGHDVQRQQPTGNIDVARTAKQFSQPLIQNLLPILKILEVPIN